MTSSYLWEEEVARRRGRGLAVTLSPHQFGMWGSWWQQQDQPEEAEGPTDSGDAGDGGDGGGE